MRVGRKGARHKRAGLTYFAEKSCPSLHNSARRFFGIVIESCLILNTVL
jgi:hypothetical protein